MTDPRLILDLYGDQAEPVDLYGMEDVPQLPWQTSQQSMPTMPQNLSQRIQEALGAREADQGGLAKDILAARFDTGGAGPSYNNYAQGVVQSALGKPQIGSSNVMEQLKQVAELERMSAQTKLYQSGGAGNQTLKLAQAIMAENPTMTITDALALVKSTGTVPLTAMDGQVTNLPGSVEAAANMAAGKKSAETTAESNAKSDTAATSTLPVINQLRQFNNNTFEMPYADTAPVRGYTRIFGNNEQQTMQQNMDLLKQARTDLAAPLAKELGVNPTDRDFQATLDRMFDSNASRESREAQINALEQRILARSEARKSGGVRKNGATPTAGGTTNWIIQDGKLVPAP